MNDEAVGDGADDLWSDSAIHTYLRDALLDSYVCEAIESMGEGWQGGWGRMNTAGLYARPGGIAFKITWFADYLSERFGEKVPWTWRAEPRGTKTATTILMREGLVQRAKHMRINQTERAYAMVLTPEFYGEVLDAHHEVSSDDQESQDAMDAEARMIARGSITREGSGPKTGIAVHEALEKHGLLPPEDRESEGSAGDEDGQSDGDDAEGEAPCALCGEKSETLCDPCSKPVCYGCFGKNVCVECAAEGLDDDEDDEDPESSEVDL